MPYITINQLRQKLRPLVDARLTSGARPYVDLHAAWFASDDAAPVHYPDCDIRALTGAGVMRCWDGKLECVDWDLIRTATFGDYRPHTDGSWYHPRVTYQVIQRQQPAQVAA